MPGLICDTPLQPVQDRGLWAASCARGSFRRLSLLPAWDL